MVYSDPHKGPLSQSRSGEISAELHFLLKARGNASDIGFDPIACGASITTLMAVQDGEALAGSCSNKWPEHPIFKRNSPVDFKQMEDIATQTLVCTWPELQRTGTRHLFAIPISADSNTIEQSLKLFFDKNNLSRCAYRGGSIVHEEIEAWEALLHFKKAWSQLNPEVRLGFDFKSTDYPNLSLTITQTPFADLLPADQYDFSSLKNAFLIIEFDPPDHFQIPILYTELAELVADLAKIPRNKP